MPKPTATPKPTEAAEPTATRLSFEDIAEIAEDIVHHFVFLTKMGIVQNDLHLGGEDDRFLNDPDIFTRAGIESGNRNGICTRLFCVVHRILNGFGVSFTPKAFLACQNVSVHRKAPYYINVK